jgi:dTDP-4-dehydrorhamnose 3,5-epimerase and related enzymes
VDLLNKFEEQRKTLIVPEIPAGSFAKKLYSTFLSYLPKEKVAFPLKSNVDARGSFTELVKTLGNGQFSVNISNPGVTKGQHWHNTKWEFFIVVSGRALIQERRIDTDEVLNFEVSGDAIQAVHMLPGYTHNIINLSDTTPSSPSCGRMSSLTRIDRIPISNRWNSIRLLRQAQQPVGP